MSEHDLAVTAKNRVASPRGIVLAPDPNFDEAQSMMGQGVISELLGMEIRQSTLPLNRVSGSSGAQTITPSVQERS